MFITTKTFHIIKTKAKVTCLLFNCICCTLWQHRHFWKVGSLTFQWKSR